MTTVPLPASTAPAAGRPRHLYVHVPFCVRRCSYCDFAIAVRRRVPVDDYLTAVIAELELRYPPTGDRWTLDTIYLGGGTPSLLGGPGVAHLLDALRSRLTPARDAEITLEANPDDVTLAAVRDWRDAGVTRLSVGAQSFDAGALSWMHRTHTAGRTAAAVENARTGGIEDVSIDLIFALPAAIGRSWAADIDAALALRPTHVSLYGLTVEPNTALGRWVARREVLEAPEESYEREYLDADGALTGAGFEHYEVSNFALGEARARHNAAYWSGAPYAAIGPAAHEFDGAQRRWNVGAYAAWAERVGEGTDPVEGSERLTAANRSAERVYLELRTVAGTVLTSDEVATVRPWVAAGWAVLDGARLSLTPKGWLRLDALAVSLANLRSRI